MITETKLDDSLTTMQFNIEGYNIAQLNQIDF